MAACAPEAQRLFLCACVDGGCVDMSGAIVGPGRNAGSAAAKQDQQLESSQSQRRRAFTQPLGAV